MIGLLLSLIKSMTLFTGSYSINVFPEPLNEEKTDAIMKTLEGDKDSRNKLIEHNSRLVAH